LYLVQNQFNQQTLKETSFTLKGKTNKALEKTIFFFENVLKKLLVHA